MENPAETGSAGEKSCRWCGSHCHCGLRAVGAIVLLLVGGIVGYLMGRCGMMSRHCSYEKTQPMESSAPVTPPAPPQKQK